MDESCKGPVRKEDVEQGWRLNPIRTRVLCRRQSSEVLGEDDHIYKCQVYSSHVISWRYRHRRKNQA
jgi:hypothetical protein